MHKRGLLFVLGLIAWSIQGAFAEVLFMDSFNQGLDAWLHVGTGTMEVVEDPSLPIHGPQVLELNNPDAANDIAYLLDFEFTDGEVLYLWRDANPDPNNTDFDADGPGFVRLVQNPGEININTAYPTGYCLEQDLDQGFHILWGVDGNGDNLALDETLKTTNEWVWTKFLLEGDQLKAKVWPIDKEEPKEWQLVAQDNRYDRGAVALRSWSGILHMAYIRITSEDAPVTFPVTSEGRLALTWAGLKR